MICRYCGADIPENDRFCSNCGAEVKAEATVNEAPVNETAGNYYGGYAEENAAYRNSQEAYYSNQPGSGGFYAGNPSQGYWTPPVNNNAPGVKEYLKWMLLYPLWNLIPGIGFVIYIIVCIKYALDTSFTARANFFKATLITMLISIAMAVVLFIVFFGIAGAATAVGFSFLEELDPSLFGDEFYLGVHEFLSVLLMR